MLEPARNAHRRPADQRHRPLAASGVPPGAVATETRRVEALADLVAIYEPDVQVVVHRRPLPARIDAILAAAAGRTAGLRRVLAPGTTPALAALPAGPGREALAADIAFLSDLYGDLLGCPRVGLRLERLDRAMCPGWHRDHTGIRLLCTYQGPGTEWLDDADLDRGGLPGSAAGRPPDGRAAAGDIVLLKGSLWQGNDGRGAIHRSPAPDGSGRWLLAVDAIW
jgi:hypothetical protein